MKERLRFASTDRYIARCELDQPARSARLMRQIKERRIYPLTLDRLEAGLKEFQRGR